MTRAGDDNPGDYRDRMAQQFAEEAQRAEEKHDVTIRVSRQHYLDMLAVWRHCRQITPLKPAALRLEQLAREIREQLDRKGAGNVDDLANHRSERR